MIIFFYGTTAEAIKLAPAAEELRQRNQTYKQWVTLQQASTVLAALPDLGLSQPDEIIAMGSGGRPLNNKRDVILWLATCFIWLVRNFSRVRKEYPTNSVIVVHGDTLTSLVGAVWGKILGFRIAHVEAGLRSGDWKNPFPEELNRRVVGGLADFHYAPSFEACEALAGKKNVVYTEGNTVRDAAATVISQLQESPRAKIPYCLVLLHRHEFLSNVDYARETFNTIARDSNLRVVVVLDDYAKSVLTPILRDLAGADSDIEPVDKLGYIDFVKLTFGAEFVITDSGGLQEELALMGIPSLIHRKATERPDGIGTNALLSSWDLGILTRFVAEYEKYAVEYVAPKSSPSKIIVEDLLKRNVN